VITCLFLVAESADQLFKASLFSLPAKSHTISDEDKNLASFLNKHHLKSLENKEDYTGDMQLPLKTTHHRS
jgi:hypothetical protein